MWSQVAQHGHRLLFTFHQHKRFAQDLFAKFDGSFVKCFFYDP